MTRAFSCVVVYNLTEGFFVMIMHRWIFKDADRGCSKLTSRKE